MGLYNKYILPKLIDSACSGPSTQMQRQKIIPLASGHVLEVGVGSGKNLTHYDPGKVSKIWGIDPSAELLQMAAPVAKSVPIEIELIEASGEKIPLETNSCNTVVSTYTLCTVAMLEVALPEVARVLRPAGQFLFCEHGAAPDAKVRQLQNRLTPLWRRVGGGCHLNRDIPKLIEANGFKLNWLESMYIPGWRFASFNYWGSATIIQ